MKPTNKKTVSTESVQQLMDALKVSIPKDSDPKSESYFNSFCKNFNKITEFNYSISTPITIIDGRIYKDHPVLLISMLYGQDFIEVTCQHLSVVFVSDTYAIELSTPEIVRLTNLLTKVFPESTIATMERITGAYLKNFHLLKGFGESDILGVVCR